jgi:hypothetical protein
MLASATVIAFYRMMGCGTGRTPSVGVCDPASIQDVLNVTRGVLAAVLILGFAVAAWSCVILLSNHREIRHRPGLRVAAWGLLIALVLLVTTLVVQTPWRVVWQTGPLVFLYGTVPASIIVAVAALLLFPATAIAKRVSAARDQRGAR